MAAGAAALFGFGTELCRRTDVDLLYAQMSSAQPSTEAITRPAGDLK
jgi:hypothetical protein